MTKKQLIYSLTIGLLLFSTIKANAEQMNRPFVIQNKIIIQTMPNEINYIDKKSEKFMRATAEREWILQNETAIKAPSSGKYYNQGLKDFNSSNYQSAINNFTSAIAIIENPQYKYAVNIKEVSPRLCYSYRGYSKMMLTDNIGAITDFNVALNKAKWNEVAEIYYLRGLARYNLKDYLGAVEDYDKAVSMNPKAEFIQRAENSYNSRILTATCQENVLSNDKLLSNVVEKQDKVSNTTKRYQLALENNSEGVKYLKQKNYKQAQKHFKSIVDTDSLTVIYITRYTYYYPEYPTNMYAYNNLAILEILNSKYKQALLHAEKAKILALSYNDINCYEKSVNLLNIAKSKLNTSDIEKINKKVLLFSDLVQRQTAYYTYEIDFDHFMEKRTEY